MRRKQTHITDEAHALLKPGRKRLGADTERQLASDLIIEGLKNAVIRELLRRRYNQADLDGMIK